MEKLSSNTKESFVSMLMGVLAIFLLSSLFENDNSKIISKRGLKILSDKNKLKTTSISTDNI